MTSIADITKRADALSVARTKLAWAVATIHDVIRQVQREKMPGLKKAAAEAKDAEAALLAEIRANPALFSDPRSYTVGGIKFGMRKGSGKMHWEDDETVVKLIRKHLPDQADILIRVEESPVSAALDQLDVKQLKAIGVTVEDAGDVPFAKDETSDIDQVLKALVKIDADEEKREQKLAAKAAKKAGKK
jgi:hypothetical protein